MSFWGAAITKPSKLVANLRMNLNRLPKKLVADLFDIGSIVRRVRGRLVRALLSVIVVALRFLNFSRFYDSIFSHFF